MTDDLFQALTLEVAPKNGRAKRLVEMRLNDRIWREEVNTGSRRDCCKAAREAAQTLGISNTEGFVDWVYPRLVRAADEADATAETLARATALSEEVDISQIIRPELFITPEVAGITVPVAVTAEGALTKVWRVYLRWADGRREYRDSFLSLDLPSGQKLWVHPAPGVPADDIVSGWSSLSRNRWLAGQEQANPAELFRDICRFVAEYLDFPLDQGPGHVATIAAFVILTYLAPVFSAVPYLFFWGTAGSGKTRALEVLRELVFRPYFTAAPSPALVFRALHAYGGTFLLDEAEKLKTVAADPSVQELLALLQAGYRRGAAASRLEPAGETFKPVSFQVFGPKALASVTGPPPVLATRCITIPMIRAGEESPKPKRRIVSKKGQPIRDALHVLALEYGVELLQLPERDVCPRGIFGRNWEVWQPILAIASWIEECGEEGLLRLVQEHALVIIEQSKEETVPATDELLLRILADKIDGYPTAGQILEAARDREPDLFRGWSARRVAEHLKSHGLRTIKRGGMKVYPPDLRDELRRIEKTHGMELLFEKQTGTTL